MKQSFFITGHSRSGTSWLEILLQNHSEVNTLSQPFPFLYRYAKEIFFKKIAYPSTYYVLNDLFGETRYSNEDLIEFLRGYHFSLDEILSVIDRMKGFSGRYTSSPGRETILKFYKPSNFLDTLSFLIDQIEVKNLKETIGSKEINCEEFLGYFLQENIKCIAILRDPRDVIASLNYGKGIEYGGEHRPTLFHIRNWRKSVHFCLKFEDNLNFHYLKYENLVSDPLKTLNKIAEFLRISPFPNDFMTYDILDQDGEIWKGNSSFPTSSILSQDRANNSRRLNNIMIKYIESMCFAEMNYLDYKVSNYPSDDYFDCLNFKEQFQIKVKNLDPRMSVLQENIRHEKKRFLIYRDSREFDKSDEQSIKSYYLTKDVLLKLIHKNE